MYFSNIRRYIRNYFGFSKAETNGFIVLIVLLGLALIIPHSIRLFIKNPGADPQHIAKLDSLAQLMGTIKKIEPPQVKYFEFNPNTVTPMELKSLGISNEIAGRIINFRGKGGSFQSKSDFKKIYGLPEEVYLALEPYLMLPSKPNYQPKSLKPNSPAKARQTFKIDINKADSTEFKRIRGIGKVLSARIVKYRNKLGGFYSISQIEEVYGISEFALENARKVLYISDKFTPKRLSVNASTQDTLGAHPYIGYKTAKKITSYRYQHGEYTSLNQLLEFGLVDQEQFQKMSQYLSL